MVPQGEVEVGDGIGIGSGIEGVEWFTRRRRGADNTDRKVDGNWRTGLPGSGPGTERSPPAVGSGSKWARGRTGCREAGRRIRRRTDCWAMGLLTPGSFGERVDAASAGVGAVEDPIPIALPFLSPGEGSGAGSADLGGEIRLLHREGSGSGEHRLRRVSVRVA